MYLAEKKNIISIKNVNKMKRDLVNPLAQSVFDKIKEKKKKKAVKKMLKKDMKEHNKSARKTEGTIRQQAKRRKKNEQGKY